MTNDRVDIQHGDVNDEHNNDENIYSINHEDQIQEGVNIRLSIINEAINRAVLELSNSELFEGKHVNFAQILSNWQENYTSLFTSIVMSDKLTLDEALIFTLDDLSDAALDLRADPDNIDKEVIDKGQVRNEERFEAVMTSISSFIEKKNENPKVKRWMLIIAGFYFFYHAIYFLNLEGAWLPIPSALYNMIIYLAICLLLLIKKENI